MDILQFRLNGQRFMVAGDVLAYDGNLHAEPMDDEVDAALLDLANARVREWRDALRAASADGRGLSRGEQRAILEQAPRRGRPPEMADATRLELRLPAALLAQIDAARGDVPRAVWVRQALERRLSEQV